MGFLRIDRTDDTQVDTIAHPDEVRGIVENRSIEDAALDVETIAETLGLEIIREPMSDDMSGYLERRNGRWVIGVNSLHNPRRQRFTIAHEIAHFVLHRNLRTDFKDVTLMLRSKGSNTEEREADAYAAQLLMPERLFREAVARGFRQVDALADLFETSVMAVKIRARELGFATKK